MEKFEKDKVFTRIFEPGEKSTTRNLYLIQMKSISLDSSLKTSQEKCIVHFSMSISHEYTAYGNFRFHLADNCQEKISKISIFVFWHFWVQIMILYLVAIILTTLMSYYGQNMHWKLANYEGLTWFFFTNMPFSQFHGFENFLGFKSGYDIIEKK